MPNRNLQPSGGRPRRHPAHLALRLDRRHHGIQRPVENRQHAVPGVPERIAGMPADGGMQDLVVQIHGAHHVIGIAAQQGGAAHDVGGENRALTADRR